MPFDVRPSSGLREAVYGVFFFLDFRYSRKKLALMGIGTEIKRMDKQTYLIMN